MENARRFSILKEKIEIDGHISELQRFENFINKISQQSFDYILNNFDFIGFHKEGVVPTGKKALTFTYGSKRFNGKVPIGIQLKSYNFYEDYYCPDNSEKIVIKFYNNYGLVALADIHGNLYCNDLYHFVDENNDNCHILFNDLISKYKEIKFPIVNFTEAILNSKLASIKSIVKDLKIEMKVIKTKIDKKEAVKLLKHELLAIESSLKAYYDTLINEKEKQIEHLYKEIERIKEIAFVDTMSIVSRLIQNNLKLKFDHSRILIDCSEIKVDKLKKNDKIYELPMECRIFKIGTIVLPYNARTLRDCRIVHDTSFHPNIDSHRPCFGDTLYKLEDIVEAIKLLKTINLDSAHSNEAYNIAIEYYYTKLSKQEQVEHVWRV